MQTAIRLSFASLILSTSCVLADMTVRDQPGARPGAVVTTTTTTRETKVISKVPDYFVNDYFKDNEWALDGFLLGTLTDGPGMRTIDLKDGFGAGVGFTQFFERYFGLGLETYGDWDGQTDDKVNVALTGSFTARYPIERRLGAYHLALAPYVFTGVGGYFGAIDQFGLHVGTGLEHRLMRHLGIFADIRWVFTEDTNDFAMLRAGVRWTFE